MIEIPQPSIALNSHDVPGAKIQMTETWNVPENVSVDWIVTFSSLLMTGYEGNFKCMVINCHGNYGQGNRKSGKPRLFETGGFGLSIGNGIRLVSANAFSQIKGQLKCIIILACGAAYVTDRGSYSGDGELLCSKIAMASGAFVIAPRIIQKAPPQIPKNHIDNFEGKVIRFSPFGGIDEIGFSGRKLIHDLF